MIAAQCIAPSSVKEAADCVAGLARAGQAMTIVGGDTLRGMGRPAMGADVVLSTVALEGVAEYAPADLTISVNAGTRLQTLAITLSAQRQFIAFDAPCAAEATVGGTLAAGWLGPRRHLYGRTRDAVIGSTAVLADGTIARAGGMVVKNVAGYDLSRLYVGSFGTLALIARANLKTRALPSVQRVFVAPVPGGARERAIAHIRGLAVCPAAAWWIRGFAHSIDGEDGDDGRLVLLFEGSDALLERATRDVRSSLGGAGVPDTAIIDAGAKEAFQRTLDAYVANLGKRSITYRLLEPLGAEHVADGLLHLCEDRQLRGEAIVDVMNGDVIARVSDLDARALAGKIEAFDEALHAQCPRAQTVAGDHPLRAGLSVWGESPAAADKMRALKARFDPRNHFNPGRFVAAI